MAPEYNQLIALFGSLDKDEQDAVLKDLKKIAEDGKEQRQKDYLETMETMMGCPITTPGSQREKAYARAIVAYTMACDGYSEHTIAKILHRDHSTIHYYKNLMQNAIKYPKNYYDLVAIYKRYTKLIEK